MADPVSTSSTIAVAFRIAQFVSSFSRRIRTRTNHYSSSLEITEIEDQFCSEWSHLKVLGQKLDRQPKSSPSARTFEKARVHNADFGGKAVAEAVVCKKRDALAELLSRLSHPDEPRHLSLSFLAKHDGDYFKDGYVCDLRGRDRTELREMLALVSLIKQVCKTGQGNLKGRPSLCTGKEISDFTTDDTYLANLLHALLCLESDLLHAIFDDQPKKDILEHTEDWQRYRALRFDIWFSVFPRGQHPLSTTWPWSIRPSLAVLWGVCWMFYYAQWDDDFNIVEAASGRIVVRFGEYEMMTDGRMRDLVSGRIITDEVGNLLLEFAGSDVGGADSRTPTTPQATAASAFGYNSPHPQPQLLPYSDGQSSYNVATAAPDTYAGLDTLIWAPAEQIEHAYSYCGLRHEQPHFSPNYAQDTYIEQDPANLADNQQAPVSANLLSQQRKGTLDHLDSNSLNNTTMLEVPHSGNFRPINSDMQSSDMHRPSTPLPLRRGSPSLRGDAEADPSSPDTGDTITSPPYIAPILNENGHRVCTFEGCNVPPFARQCEYKKHTDRHRRPYICQNPECTTLRGFTYLGGLLRHQREVHQTTRDLFFCSAPGCKRQTEGFTRRENMEEHFRRIHKKKQSITSPDKLKLEENVDKQHTKRKRCTSNSGDADSEAELEQLRRENKRLKEENLMLKEKLAVKMEPQTST